MTMSDFQESGINFCFKSSWMILKYDDHVAHKKVEKFLKSTKAVDFLGIHNDKLYFVEIKNYRGHTQDESTKEVLGSKGEELMHRIAIKVRDAMASSIGSARFSTNDNEFFAKVNQLLLDDNNKIMVIACVELDVSNEKERKAKMGIWQQKLKQKLSWLHAAKISVNSVDNITDIIPDLDVSFVE